MATMGNIDMSKLAPRLRSFTGVHVPSAAAQATITIAAPGAGKKNVCTMLSVTAMATGAGTAATLLFELIDGATGGAAKLWTGRIGFSASPGVSWPASLSDIWIEGSENTAMTLEVTTTPGTAISATVSIAGVIINV